MPEEKEAALEDVVIDLLEWIGPSAAALVCEARLRMSREQWLNSLPSLKANQIERLRFTHEMIEQVAEAESSTDTARAWLLGANTITEGSDDEVSPLHAIREYHYQAVRNSAQMLTTDSFS